MSKKQITIDTYNSVAEAYQSKFMEMNMYNDCYDAFCKHIENGYAKILEVACGPGNVTKYLLCKNPNYNILGIDLAPNMVTLAKENVPEASFEVMDCLEINKLSKQFDAIMCAFCLPYLSSEQFDLFLKHAHEKLIKNGVLYISTMEGEYSDSGFETTSFSGDKEVFIYYYKHEYLQKKFEDTDFEIIDFQTKKYPEPDGNFLIDLIYVLKRR